MLVDIQYVLVIAWAMRSLDRTVLTIQKCIKCVLVYFTQRIPHCEVGRVQCTEGLCPGYPLHYSPCITVIDMP